jgi:hypothetical protein
LDTGASLHTELESSAVMIRCLSSLEDLLYAEGVAGVKGALVQAVTSSGERLSSAQGGCWRN